jgi:glycosyltransferase involved in cell wall biosynthesis
MRSASSLLRICHLGKYYPPAPGGMEAHVRTLALAQAALGAEVQVVCVNHADADGRDVTWMQFGTSRTVEDRDGPVRVTRLGRTASLARFDYCPDLLGTLTQLQRNAVDILHVHTPNPNMLLALSALRLRTPLVITHHSDIVRQKVLKLALEPFERRIYGKATRILSTSPEYPAGSIVLQRYLEKVEPLPLGVDLTPYTDPSEAAQAYAENLRKTLPHPLWLAVGRLVYYKGLHIAVDALRQVPGTLIFVGDGLLEADLRRQAEQRNVADRIVWKAYLSPEELAGAYRAATALWFPSTARSEGFGLVQVEAMASGCPVINTAIPASGVSWVSRHEETGLTVPVHDPAAFAAAARRLLDQSGLRDRLGTAARERACREFDHRRMAQRSLAIYDSILSRNGRTVPSTRKLSVPMPLPAP